MDSAERVEALTHAVRRVRAPLVRVVTGVGALFVGGALALFVWGWLHRTPALSLTTVTVAGNVRASEAELVRLAGLSPGMNVLEVDLQALERALAAHPWVKAVHVDRHLPHGIAARIEEHEPRALVMLQDLYLIDADGNPFKKLQAGDVVDLPLISGIDRDQYMENPTRAEARFRAALAAITAYQAAGFPANERLSEVRVESDELTLITGRGEEVRVGEGELDGALGRLRRIRSELSRRGLSADVIHLDNRARPGWVAVKISTPVSERSGASK